MNPVFNKEQLTRIVEQAMLQQCACPSLASKVASDLQYLYEYQQNCINQDETDVRVHRSIAKASAEAYAIMERCLIEVLELEGWNMDTLDMPPDLLKRQLESVCMTRHRNN